MWQVTAWVKDSPNLAPIARCETRSFTLAAQTAKLWRAQGFRVETTDTIEQVK